MPKLIPARLRWLCALPAFVLLALVPLVAGAFEALHP